MKFVLKLGADPGPPFWMMYWLSSWNPVHPVREFKKNENGELNWYTMVSGPVI